MLTKYGVTRECQISPTFDVLHIRYIGIVCIAIFFRFSTYSFINKVKYYIGY